jgi:hypothetical protein
LPRIRVLQGYATGVRCGEGSVSVSFNIGEPPEYVTTARPGGGPGFPVREGEYLAIAVKREILGDKRNVILAYRLLGQRGEAQPAGYLAATTAAVACCGGLIFSTAVIFRSSNIVGAVTLVLVSAVVGSAAFCRLRDIRAAMRALSNCKSI